MTDVTESQQHNETDVVMAAEWGLQPPDYAPKARTQLFDIHDTADVMLEKLLQLPSTNGWGIDAICITKVKEYSMKWDDFFIELHREIQNILSLKLGTKNNREFQYQTLRKGNSYLVMFLSPDARPYHQWVNELKIKGFDQYKIAQTVLGLRLKLHFLDNAGKYFEVSHGAYNSEIFLGAVVQKEEPDKRGNYYVDALQSDLFYSPDYGDLTFTLKGICFRAKAEELGVLSDYGRILIKGKKSLQLLEKVDGRKYRKMPYMRFASKAYSGCKNHAENLVQNVLGDILSQADIAFSPRVFCATHSQLDFLTTNIKTLQRPLVIIDNLDNGEEPEAHQRFIHYLKKELDAVDIISPRELIDLDKDVNYLVLNQSKKINGSSISLGEDTFLNSTWQALNEAKAGKKGLLDYYSRLKVDFILDFEKNHQRVFQGCNIETIEQNKKDPVTLVVKKVLNPVSVAKLEMICSELWLKEAVLVRKKLTGFSINDGEYILVSIRCSSSGNRRGNDFYGVATPVVFSHGVMNIAEPKMYTDENDFRNNVPGMNINCIDKLRDDNFYLVDTINQVVIKRYNTVRIPRLLGSAERCSLQVAEDNHDKINKFGAADKTCLPYYLTPKPKSHAVSQYQQLFIEKRGNEALLFCTKSNQPNQIMDRATLVYNLVATTFDGKEADVMAQPATELLLRTLTYDTTRYNEVSQTSLLEKISRLMLHN
ncbi:TPA: hypothetical protein KE776_004470 [Escherichia coli]|nr:hypothetical protein [Escherichia coli]HBC9018997.1 hypothetical protein [Escherichia coli]